MGQDKASSETGRWAMLIWRRPDLIVIEAIQPNRWLWRHHQLSPGITPKILAAQKTMERATLVRHGPQIERFQQADELLSLLGCSSPEPPTDCY